MTIDEQLKAIAQQLQTTTQVEAQKVADLGRAIEDSDNALAQELRRIVSEHEQRQISVCNDLVMLAEQIGLLQAPMAIQEQAYVPPPPQQLPQNPPPLDWQSELQYGIQNPMPPLPKVTPVPNPDEHYDYLPRVARRNVG